MKKVAAAVIVHNGRVLIARRKAGETHAGLWEFPGGKIEGHETPQECLEREILEELGLSVRAGHILAEAEDRAGHGRFTIIAVEAGLIGGSMILTVHDDVQWVGWDELRTFSLAPADRVLAEKIGVIGCMNGP